MSTGAALRLTRALVGSAPAEDQDDAQISSAIETSPQSSRQFSDEELLEYVGRGSKEALGTLFLRHGRAVLHVASRILRDSAEADDLRQDVFVCVFEKAKFFDRGKGSGSSWIMQIAYHRAIDRRRYLANRQHYDAPIFDEQQSPLGVAPLSTDVIDGKAILSRLRETLSVDQRETLELHLFEGYSLREIAEKKGESVGNVRHHYYRALDRLRVQLVSRKRE
jgi:RNA polymerase sigma-70 factor (ECF subfamily)